MKALPAGPGNSQWENKLLNDLTFIKKHGRYPFNKKTLAPSLLFGMLLLYGIRMIWVVLLVNRAHNIFTTVFISCLILVMLSIAIGSYINTLRFTSIPTRFFASENERLLKQFLEYQQLAYTRLNNAPEVFAIISRNISASQNEQREVMVFIADNKRILINSHFTNQKFSFTAASRNYKQMANRLKEWINIHIDNDNTTIIPVNGF